MKGKMNRLLHIYKVSMHNLVSVWNKNWYKYLIIVYAGFVIHTKDLNMQIQLSKSNIGITDSSYFNNDSIPIKKNVSFVIPEKENLEKKNRYEKYIEKHAPLAIHEMKKYGIPASVKLAQGLLETNAGKSKLYVECKNNFGIKCFSKKCKKGHCRNFEDDSHKDFFKNYSSTAESYRDHSVFLQKKRYRHLFDIGISDYEKWCYGLKEAGYATDKKYPEKLIRIIKKYELYRFDN